ncbi:lysozyme inhibitor LprI family protein [Roseomonas sp. E05]|uniref:lysozyme inhibitor LprI family protein n=1 Tax=Roseomonas sp. E05 TaxID=3046310 RepID=UPI0024BAEB2E|nr:lysozyme inhibitor LprI family protein [Roseomonas sp. E05]MDJ0387100.1 lysozyme inhibitor LprI family protein [Roseomonas sp. E05]
MRKTLPLAILFSIASGAHLPLAEPAGQETDGCLAPLNTAAIVTCLDTEAEAWDQRLNTAYAALQKRIFPQQREPLRAAQRLWIHYRDANCRFYGAQDGSIRQIEVALCRRDMTRSRARELDAAMPAH